MLITGVVGEGSNAYTAQLIYSLLSEKGIRVGMTDTGRLSSSGNQKVEEYFMEMERSRMEFIILKINLEDMDNMFSTRPKFDILIYNDVFHEEPGSFQIGAERLRKLFLLLDRNGTVIINVDNKELVKALEGLRNYAVTYGFNPKASITTSSIGDEIDENCFMCCLQRSLITRSGRCIEPQEYMFRVNTSDVQVHNVLAAAAFALINDINLNYQQ